MQGAKEAPTISGTLFLRQYERWIRSIFWVLVVSMCARYVSPEDSLAESLPRLGYLSFTGNRDRPMGGAVSGIK